MALALTIEDEIGDRQQGPPVFGIGQLFETSLRAANIFAR